MGGERFRVVAYEALELRIELAGGDRAAREARQGLLPLRAPTGLARGDADLSASISMTL